MFPDGDWKPTSVTSPRNFDASAGVALANSPTGLESAIPTAGVVGGVGLLGVEVLIGGADGFPGAGLLGRTAGVLPRATGVALGGVEVE